MSVPYRMKIQLWKIDIFVKTKIISWAVLEICSSIIHYYAVYKEFRNKKRAVEYFELSTLVLLVVNTP